MGATSVQAISDATLAGTGCRACVPTLNALLTMHAGRVLPVDHAPTTAPSMPLT